MQRALLDLKVPAGVDAFLHLAARADVMIESFRPGVVDRLGIGYTAVIAVNPGIVFTSLRNSRRLPSGSIKKSTRANPDKSHARKAATAISRTCFASARVSFAVITGTDPSERYFAS